MPIQFGTNKIKSVYYGGDKIKEIYHGTELVYKSGSGIKGWYGKNGDIDYYLVGKTDYLSNENVMATMRKSTILIDSITGVIGQLGSVISAHNSAGTKFSYEFYKTIDFFGVLCYGYKRSTSALADFYVFAGTTTKSNMFSITSFDSGTYPIITERTSDHWSVRSKTFTVTYTRNSSYDTDDFVQTCISGKK